MRFEIVYPAPPGECFAHGTFDGQIGKPVRIKIDEGTAAERVTSGVLIRAEVANDGRRAALTFESEEELWSTDAEG